MYGGQVWKILVGDEEEHGTVLYNFLYHLVHLPASSDDYIFVESEIRNQLVKRYGEAASGRIIDGQELPHVAIAFVTDSLRLVTSSPGYPSVDVVATERVFLVLGKGMPEGDLVYILLRLNLE